MKKILFVAFALILFVACRADDADDYLYSYDEGEELVYEEDLAEDAYDAYDTTDASPYELCDCGWVYAHEVSRRPTPPMNIHEIFAIWQGMDYEFPMAEHEANIAEFVRDFENIHTATEIQ